MQKLYFAAALALTLSGCALFQQVPGRVTHSLNGDTTTEAGGVYGETTPVPGNCPSIRFMGNQDVGKVTASCTGNGASQSLSAEAITASTNTKAAIDGMVALGGQMTSLAQSVIALLGVAKAGATGGMGMPGPVGEPGAVAGPMLVCPTGTIIGLAGGRTVCLP